MAGETGLYIVAKQDTVVQMREYLVRARSKEHAQKCVDQGLFLCETEAETMDTLASKTTACEQIHMDIYDDQVQPINLDQD